MPGGPFLHPDSQQTYIFSQYHYDAGEDIYGKGFGYNWPFGMENWVNLEGKYLHLVADMSRYDTDTVSVLAQDFVSSRSTSKS